MGMHGRSYRPHDLHRCYNLQRRSVVQRRASRHLLEAWYFWLGSALLVVSVIFVVSILVKCIELVWDTRLFTLKSLQISVVHVQFGNQNKHNNIQGIPSGRNARINDNRQNAQEFNQPQRANENQTSISIVPTTFSSQRKMLVIGAQPSFTHMTPVVA
ncbi:uncharacterized protein [Mycetomoellerius zeteki]|uniref:uncharacterized protein n=1 Tax=Mycetomoellerius zeteki TaxID=64791 RepID=UPI00084E7BB8|nr:PREDICTED: uncharacterized protein LOC108721124 [Trachymyrmex zeteki]